MIEEFDKSRCDARKRMKINHEETKGAEISSILPSRLSFFAVIF
jgi:hypothetical protein